MNPTGYAEVDAHNARVMSALASNGPETLKRVYPYAKYAALIAREHGLSCPKTYDWDAFLVGFWQRCGPAMLAAKTGQEFHATFESAAISWLRARTRTQFVARQRRAARAHRRSVRAAMARRALREGKL